MAQKSYLQVFTEELRKLVQQEKDQKTPQELGIKIMVVDCPVRFKKLTFLPHLESGSFVTSGGNLLFYVKFY